MYHEADCEILEMTLNQMNAKSFQSYDGTLFFFEFEINEKHTLRYSFDVNDNNEYNLRRLEPYRFFHGQLHSQQEVIALVKQDLARFKDAANSSNFDRFVEIENQLQDIGNTLDDMFLNFNVDKEALKDMQTNIVDIKIDILATKERSEAIVLKEGSETK